MLNAEREILRSTLRAARDVHSSFDGFDKAYRRVLGLDLHAHVAVVAAGLGEKRSAVEQDVYEAGMRNLIDPLLAFVNLLSTGGRKLTDRAPGGKTMSHEDFHAWLFRLGTGWLGWSERETLDASMSGILLAYEGRGEMLRAIFGGKAPEKSQGIPVSDVAGVRAMLRAMGTRRDHASAAR